MLPGGVVFGKEEAGCRPGQQREAATTRYIERKTCFVWPMRRNFSMMWDLCNGPFFLVDKPAYPRQNRSLLGSGSYRSSS